jgi:hypothetical protein
VESEEAATDPLGEDVQSYCVGKFHSSTRTPTHDGVPVNYRMWREIDATSSHLLHGPWCEPSRAWPAIVFNRPA